MIFKPNLTILPPPACRTVAGSFLLQPLRLAP